MPADDGMPISTWKQPPSPAIPDAYETCRFLYPISRGLELLLPELRSVEEAEEDSQIGDDWQTSSDFQSNLWRNFKEEFGLTKNGLLDVENCGVKRFNELLRSNHHLICLEELLDVLKTAAQNIRMPIIAGLKSAGQKFGRLLQRLPNEILAETMRYACSDVFDLIKLSHVNRRFRETALSMADWWSNVSSSMPTEVRRVCLERGRNAALHVVFDEGDSQYKLVPESGDCFEELVNGDPSPESRMYSYVCDVARCCARWKDIKMVMPKSTERRFEFDSDSYALYRLLSNRETFRDLYLPRLESLALYHRGDVPDILEEDDFNCRTVLKNWMHFYHSWKAPHLRTLLFSGIVPVPIPGASIQTLILDLRVLESKMNYLVAIHDLMEFFQETPSLQKLRLYIYSSGLADADQAVNLPPIKLESLRQLTFIVDEWIATPPANENIIQLATFVKCLDLPNLSTFRLRLSLTEPEAASNADVSDLVSSFIPGLGGSHSLENLSIFVFDPKESSHPTMNLVLDKYSSLRSLTVGITGQLVLAPGSTLHPNVKKQWTLKHVNLHACFAGAGQFLAWIVAQLREGYIDSGAQRLGVEVRRCGSEPKSRLLVYVLPDKLEFEEDNNCGNLTVEMLEKCGFYCGDSRRQ